MKIKIWKTDSDAKVYYVHQPQNPMIEIDIIFKAGSAYDENQYGIAQLTNMMLSQGTENYNEAKIAMLFDDVGANFFFNTLKDTTSIGLQSLSEKKYFDKAIKLFTEILTQPIFPTRAFKTSKQMVLNAIEQQQTMPDLIASNVFFNSIYQQHPYAHLTLGTIKTVKKLSIIDLKNFYHRFYTAKNSIITIVGDIDENHAIAVANELTAGLPRSSKLITLNEPVVNCLPPQLIQFPAIQSQILLGQIAINYDHPDYFPLYLATQLLGGPSAAARLFKEVREKHGLTYDISCQLSSFLYKGLIIIHFQTKIEMLEKALNLTEKIIDEFTKFGPSRKELSLVQRKIVNGFPLTTSTNAGISNVLARLALFNLPINFFDDYCDNIKAVTIKEIKNASMKYLQTQSLQKVVVGLNE